MFLSIATTHRPATDLGFLLMKHPDRAHTVDLAFGRGHVFFPEANEARAEAALVIDIDPVGLVRGRGEGDGLLDQYVNDRPYAASSFLSVALIRAYRTAMSGASRERPELAASALPLEIVVTPLPASGDGSFLRTLFEPLGWRVSLERIAGSRYVELRLEGVQRLSEALSHLYVLIPVTDDDKHYWVGDDEVDKLVQKGGAWLATHPERETIARRYLKRRRTLVSAALQRLTGEGAEESEEATSEARREETLEGPTRLHDRRLDAVAQWLEQTGARKVADLGCGEGKLIARLAKVRRFETIFGLDASVTALQRAMRRLKLETAPASERERIRLLHGALTYRDTRWAEAEAAALVEVIEHLDVDRLPALESVVFAASGLKTVIVTTPNVEYNVLFPTLGANRFRHPDHRFEWTRAEFRAWAQGVAARRGYTVEFRDIGDVDPERGPICQAAAFTR